MGHSQVPHLVKLDFTELLILSDSDIRFASAWGHRDRSNLLFQLLRLGGSSASLVRLNCKLILLFACDGLNLCCVLSTAALGE